MIKLEVQGKIIPKARPRVTTVNGHTIAYTPKPTRQYEELIYLNWVQAGKPTLNTQLFTLDIQAYFTAPKSLSNKKRQALDSSVCNNKKDIDNIAKIVLDALNGYAYSDDHNCVKLSIEKRYTLKPDDYIIVEIKPYEIDTLTLRANCGTTSSSDHV